MKKKLSPKTAERLEQAGDYAEQLARSGEDSLTALAKAANKYDLKGEQGHLLVRGWNTARVRDLFEHSKEAGDRVADLDVVDIHTFDRVRGATKSAYYEENVEPEVWEGYSLTPEYSVPKNEVPYTPLEDPTILPRQIKTAEKLIQKKFDEYTSTVKIATDEITRLRAEIVQKLDQCRKDLFASGIDPEVVGENLKVAHAGAYKIFDSLRDSFIKRADYSDYILYDPKKLPYKTLIECAELVEKTAAFQKKYDTLLKQYEHMKVATGYYERREAAEAIPLLDPTPGYPKGYYPSYDIFNPRTLLSTDDAESILKEGSNADFFQNRANQGASGTPGDPNNTGPQEGEESAYAAEVMEEEDKKRKNYKLDKDTLKWMEKGLDQIFGSISEWDVGKAIEVDMRDKVNKKVFNPHTQAVTRAARLPILVTKLVSSDEILSNYSPKKVQEAFSYLHELAPSTMENPAVAKEFLRKYLEQGETLDSYDMKLLVDMESRRQKWSPAYSMD